MIGQVDDETNCDEIIYGWVAYIKNNNEDLLKYGNALLMLAIEINDLKLMNPYS